MKLSNVIYSGLLATAVLVSCQKKEEKPQDHAHGHAHEHKDEKEKNKKRKPLDFTPVKAELKLDAEKQKQFDEITSKYQKIREENYKAAKQSGKMDRVAMGIKNEELTQQQADEMAKVLSPEQMQVFNKFVEENSRKRPRYNNQLLAKIQKEVGLSDDQMKVVNAANDAFEKAFHDAHDIYHGNNDLAKQYWDKFNAQRNSAIEKILSPEQVKKFQEITSKEAAFRPREKK